MQNLKDLYKLHKLGKLPVKLDPRTLKMAKYLDHNQIPTPPLFLDYSSKLSSIGMMRNDVLGCCTIAGAAHQLQVWSANATKQITLTDDEVEQNYSDICGYVKGDPTTDNGGVELFVLNALRQTGLKRTDGTAHKIKAYIALEAHNLDHIKTAVWLFGGAYIGVGLPVSAQKQTNWKVSLGGTDGDIKPNSWGGHCVNVIGYDSKGLLCLTWGTVQRMTYSWWDVYCDEAYALLSPDWFAFDGKAPSGFDEATLTTDLAHVTG